MAKHGGRQGASGDLFTPAPLPVAPLDDRQRLACVRLIRSENVGPVTFRELINHFGGAQQALDALPEVGRRSGRGRPIRVCPAERAEAELEAATRAGARPIFTIEPDYPPALAHLAVPPPLLYVRGRGDLLARDGLAIVGSRNSSAAGAAMARLVATGVGTAGYVIVSGLARGIDGAAHEAALATGTIAVLAGGIDFVYPPENAALHAEIAERGTIVTEMPPGFVPRGQDFPRRNRIISGLSLGVVVIEAARRSGSVLTAHHANEQGRLVMAVPGHPLDPRSEGPNGLLKQPGVELVTSAQDVIAALEPMRGRITSERRPAEFAEGELPDRAMTAAEPPDDGDRAPPPGTPPIDASEAVLAALGAAPTTVDDLARAARLSPRDVRSALLELSLAGLVEHTGTGLISKKPGR